LEEDEGLFPADSMVCLSCDPKNQGGAVIIPALDDSCTDLNVNNVAAAANAIIPTAHVGGTRSSLLKVG